MAGGDDRYRYLRPVHRIQHPGLQPRDGSGPAGDGRQTRAARTARAGAPQLAGDALPAPRRRRSGYRDIAPARPEHARQHVRILVSADLPGCEGQERPTRHAGATVWANIGYTLGFTRIPGVIESTS